MLKKLTISRRDKSPSKASVSDKATAVSTNTKVDEVLEPDKKEKGSPKLQDEKLAPTSSKLKSTPASKPTSTQPVQSEFASISFNASDLIRVIRLPSPEINAIRAAILQLWSRGIQKETAYPDSHQFKLKGNPWHAQGPEAVPSRKLMCTIVSTMHDHGWVNGPSVDVGQKLADNMDSIFFRRPQPPAPAKAKYEWFSMLFKGELLRLVGAPEDELIEPIRQALGVLLLRDGWEDEYAAYEFKCKGCPWFETAVVNLVPRVLLFDLLSVLESHGFRLYASLDQRIGTSGDAAHSQAVTWFCSRKPNWAAGDAVY